MRKLLFLSIALLGLATVVSAQKKYGLYAVAFSNMENLFDTIHDEGKNDYDFLPNGSYHWDQNKYENKLKNMAQVALDLGTDKLPGIGASIIGLAEVENSNTLDDLLKQPGMKERGFQYIHIEGPDKRGIDCALLYNPQFFSVRNSFLQPYVYDDAEQESKYATRGFLTVQGELAGDPLTVIVCHWPSRAAKSYYRELGGKQVRALVDSIWGAEPDMRIIVMGDMNDDPDNASMTKALGAVRKYNKMKDGEFFNPWWDILRSKGQGTISYQGGWNLFDQIVMSKNILDGRDSKDYSHLTLYDWHIFRRDYLLQQEGKYKGSPKRTTASGVWLNGYSDHLPTVTYLVKEL